MKERALRTRAVKNIEALGKHSKDLPPLKNGDRVFMQNQTGNHPKKWDRTGTITECLQHNQYSVVNDQSGKLTLRNRQFLRKYVPTAKNVLLGIPLINSGDVTEPTQPPSQTKTTIPDDLQHPPTNGNEDPEACQQVGDESPATESPATDDEPVPSVRRSSRTRKQAKVYDASSGKYVEP